MGAVCWNGDTVQGHCMDLKGGTLYRLEPRAWKQLLVEWSAPLETCKFGAC